MTNLENLKKNFKRMTNDEIVCEMWEICEEYDMTHMLRDIVTHENIIDYLNEMIESNGWERAKFFLESVKNITDDFYIINGYGNLENVTRDYLSCVLYDIETEIEALEME